jgi:putative transposase
VGEQDPQAMASSGLTRNFKFRLYPTKTQEAQLEGLLEQHRQLYNAALEERLWLWRDYQVSTNYTRQANQLKELRQEREDLARYSYSAMQQTLRRLDKAYRRFFKDCRLPRAKREGAGKPRFKTPSRFKSVTFIQGDGAKFLENKRDWLIDQEAKLQAGHSTTPKAWAKLRLAGFEKGLRVKQHRLIEGDVKQVQVKRSSSGRWYAMVICTNIAKPEPLPATGKDVGVDAGCVTLMATSEGELFTNPRYSNKLQTKKAIHQRQQSRSKRGSKRWRKAGARRARVEEKIQRQRRDNHFKLAKQLVNHYDRIAIEDLQIKNMTKSARGTVNNPGRNVSQKSGLNKSILDAGWGQFREILLTKADEAGREVAVVKAAYSSQECSSCGDIDKKNRPSQEKFKCLSCGFREHADVNAAKNLLIRAGWAQRESKEIISTKMNIREEREAALL